MRPFFRVFLGENVFFQKYSFSPHIDRLSKKNNLNHYPNSTSLILYIAKHDLSVIFLHTVAKNQHCDLPQCGCWFYALADGWPPKKLSLSESAVGCRNDDSRFTPMFLTKPLETGFFSGKSVSPTKIMVFLRTFSSINFFRIKTNIFWKNFFGTKFS